MTQAEQLASELRDVCMRGRRLFRSVGRGETGAVDILDELMADVGRVADRLAPPPRSRDAAAAVVEGRFTPGTIAPHGRLIRVETRRRRAA